MLVPATHFVEGAEPTHWVPLGAYPASQTNPQTALAQAALPWTGAGQLISRAVYEQLPLVQVPVAEYERKVAAVAHAVGGGVVQFEGPLHEEFASHASPLRVKPSAQTKPQALAAQAGRECAGAGQTVSVCA